jgi:hypothetical protein
MKKLIPLSFALLALGSSAVGCAGPARPTVPLSAAERPTPVVTLVWLGKGKAQRMEGKEWKRIPSFDYEFSVVQRRYTDHWESIKEMHRRHPDYDGSAGPRDITYAFNIDYQATQPDGRVTGTIWSTLGDGQITTDREFRRGQLELTAANVSSFAPFNTYRITQSYQYEEAKLTEVVELLKREKGTDVAWVRNDEEAELFGQKPFPAPPTTR